MNDLKICLVSDTIYDLNGVSRFIQDFAKVAIKENKEFYVIGSTLKNCDEDINNIYNLKPLFKIKMPFYKSLDLVFPNFLKIHKKIKEINPTLLHISTPGFVGFSALISSKILGIPVIGIYHTDFPSYLYKNTNSKVVLFITKLFLKIFYKSFKKLFTRTEEYKEILINDLSFDKENLITLKSGIDLNKFDKSFRDNNIWGVHRLSEKSLKALYVGRISVEKNVDKLIELWKESNFKNIDLVLVGDLEFNVDKKYLKKFNIYFLGRVKGEELSTIYASSSFFLFPSTTDTLGQVVMEAMASGLPVIVTNKGGPKEFINEKIGYVLDINDKKSWKKTIKLLSKDEYILKEKSINAINFMKDNSILKSFEDFWNKNLQIYKELSKK